MCSQGSTSDCSCKCASKVIKREQVRAPSPPPIIRRVVERAPTPEQDIIERVKQLNSYFTLMNTF